ncbi:MAG TPA: hypothetical protein VMY41_16955 [Thermohalobaculum sp.]|nr:hypothetical protein [Thermohalobaculum sp.]
MRHLLASTTFLVFLSGTASAEAFKVGDLGEITSRRACLETAAEVLEAYVNEFGGRSTDGELDVVESWAYYGWDLRPGDIDVVITCPVVADRVNAFYTLYSSGDNEQADADTAATRLRELWERLY